MSDRFPDGFAADETGEVYRVYEIDLGHGGWKKGWGFGEVDVDGQEYACYGEVL